MPLARNLATHTQTAPTDYRCQECARHRAHRLEATRSSDHSPSRACTPARTPARAECPAIRPALPKPTKKRKNARNSQPGMSAFWSGVDAMMPVAIATFHEDPTATELVRHPAEKNAPGTA